MEGYLFSDEAELQAACEWYQERLRLMDWRIEAVHAHAKDVSSGSAADITHNHEHRIARIQLILPEELNPPMLESFPEDEEETLIHELLHIFYAYLEGDKVRLEQGLNATARAMVEMRREAYAKEPWRRNGKKK